MNVITKTKTYFGISLIIVTLFLSCKKADDNKGVPTIITGIVADNYRGLKINNYKIRLFKTWSCFKGFMSSGCSEEVATTHTDENGFYSINFNYKLESGQSYALFIGEDGPYTYTSELNTTKDLQQGLTNVRDVNAWLPVKIKLNLDVKNNLYKQLIVGVNYANYYSFGTDFIYETDIKRTLELRCRPSSDISIDFWYYENYNKGLGKHFKSIPYKTTLANLTEITLEVDCAKF